MRDLHEREIRKNGCQYCLDVVRKRKAGIIIRCCPYDKCPYRELGEFETYHQYLKSKGDLIFLRRKKK